jgi:two-component system, LytTR family, sensor kinase
MKEFFKNPSNLRRIEFWAATTIFVFAIFFLITSGVRNGSEAWAPNSYYFEEHQVKFNYYKHYFIPEIFRYVTLYLAFLVVNFVIVPQVVRKESILLNTVLAVIIFAIIAMAWGITGTYIQAYLFKTFKTNEATYRYLFQKSFLYSAWLLLLFGFYSVIKQIGIYLLYRSEEIQARYGMVTPGGLVAFVLWMLSMFLLLVVRADREAIVIWGIIVPFGIVLYWHSLQTLIPAAINRKNPLTSYLLKVLLIQLVTALPVGLICLLLSNNEDASLAVAFFNAVFQVFLTAPFSWIVYKRITKSSQQIRVLKQELGRSNANFDFLRSQINPHFLFNALNTIYGTAIQEKAERTSEGVEKLGNMMRFMLQENMQEKISLAREIDYLNNYIDLQKLRTDTNPIIRIETAIQEQVIPVQISPMLLIPFVENAFKHGISLREPSHIKVTLEMREKTLYFDVYNSKHVKQEKDPEKDKSGIGLNNVKQRLQLFYPKKHELVIRETAKDFFVHLTIQLG